MLYSQGVPMESLGVPRRDGGAVETDPPRIWQRFADHFHLFRGTPSGVWLGHEFEHVFGITERLDSSSAMRIYDRIAEQLATPAFRPRALFERFRIEVLCTTDAAGDSLEWHQKLQASGWRGDVRPTFRPDLAIALTHPGWRAEVDRIARQAGTRRGIGSYGAYIGALEQPPGVLQVARRVRDGPRGGHAVDRAACPTRTPRPSSTAPSRAGRRPTTSARSRRTC